MYESGCWWMPFDEVILLSAWVIISDEDAVSLLRWEMIIKSARQRILPKHRPRLEGAIRQRERIVGLMNLEFE